MEHQPGRSEYKKVWSALSTTHDQAKLHVIGVTDEDALRTTGEETLGFLQQSVGIRKDDVVLEIGCGIGRVGRVVAPLCRKWIGGGGAEYAKTNDRELRLIGFRTDC